MKTLTLAAMVLAVSSAAHADPSALEIYYVPKAQIDLLNTAVPGGKDSGNGFGTRAFIRANDLLVFTGEYQKLHYDDSGLDGQTLRGGAGLAMASTTGIYLDYRKQTVKGATNVFEADGFEVRGRLAGVFLDSFQPYFELGYLRVDRNGRAENGNEAVLGAALKVANTANVFVDYRRVQFEGGDMVAFSRFYDFRAGGGLSFGK